MAFRASMIFAAAALALAACATGSSGIDTGEGGGGGGDAGDTCESARQHYLDCTGEELASNGAACEGEELCAHQCFGAASCEAITALTTGGDAGDALYTCILTCTGGGSSCDNTGACSDPNDSEAGCTPCAFDTVCAAEASACGNQQDCLDFNDCIGPCEDDACYQDCQAQHPSGADTFNTLASCVICKACPLDCDAVSICE